jgi:hypothetical protein
MIWRCIGAKTGLFADQYKPRATLNISRYNVSKSIFSEENMNKVTDRKLEDIYMHTCTGEKYFPFSPKPEHVDIETIAHHLATAGRWNGATRRTVFGQADELIFYSVAEHSVYVSNLVEIELGRPDLAMTALLHDASEAYIGDLIRPLKYSAAFYEPFKDVEDLNEMVIAEAFDLEWPWHPVVKQADEIVCDLEFNQIVPLSPTEVWDHQLHVVTEKSNVPNLRIEMLSPSAAKRHFLDTYNRLRC